MHKAQKMGNTLGISKSTSSDWLNSTGFPGDVCVTFFNGLPGNKDAVTPNPLMEEESLRVYNCVNEPESGSTKCHCCCKLVYRSQPDPGRIQLRPKTGAMTRPQRSPEVSAEIESTRSSIVKTSSTRQPVAQFLNKPSILA
ncbi:hypothetical protein DPX16_17823 [Anabarilius grahami]|uniref:Uncharacterized protein n=1 Tax=Anabarilius grahami TaxID=495550 RepID=A0A3N0YHU6_ANAGA|nr:hypothetical protein DPX16_17823 [Anabarilius grahami]